MRYIISSILCGERRSLSLHFNNRIFWTPLPLAPAHGLAVLLRAGLHTLQGVLARSGCNGASLARSTRPVPIPYRLFSTSPNKKPPALEPGVHRIRIHPRSEEHTSELQS